MSPEHHPYLSYRDIEELKIRMALVEQDQKYMKDGIDSVREDISEIKALITGGRGAWKAVSVLFGLVGMILSIIGFELFGKLFSKVSSIGN